MAAAGSPRDAVAISASLKRALIALPATFLLCFAALKLPEGPYSAEPNATPEVLVRLRQTFDVGASLWQQLVTYLVGVLHGDFGPSMRLEKVTVGEAVDEVIGGTVMLIAVALAAASLVAWCLAVLDQKMDSRVSVLFDSILALLVAMPIFPIVMIVFVGFGVTRGAEVVQLLVAPAIGGLALGIAYHFLRRHFAAAGQGAVLAASQAAATCLPLLVLIVLTVEFASKRVGLGLLLMLSARNADVTLAAGLALCFAAIIAVLDVLSTLLIYRIAKATAVDRLAVLPIEVRRHDRHAPRQTVWRSVAALVLLAPIGLVSLAAAVSGQGPDNFDFEAIGTPPSVSSGHWLGSDRLGRDNLALAAAAVKTSLGSALLAGLAGTALGAIFGTAIGAFGNNRYRFLKPIIDGLAIVPWPAVALCFAAAGLPSLAVLSVTAMSAPVIARLATEPRPQEDGVPRQHPAIAMMAAASLSVAYAVLAGNALEIGNLGPDLPTNSIGNVLITHLDALQVGHGWLAFLITAALPVLAVAGFIQLSFSFPQRQEAIEDPYARVF